MTESIPELMRALALSEYGTPSAYDNASLPTPKIEKADEVLIKVKAASINPIDVKLASGIGKIGLKASFPYKIGFDVAGTVVAVGTAVTSLKVGDQVYSRAPDAYRGSVAEYTISTEYATSLKPVGLSYVDSASIPLAGLTALQCLQRADDQLLGGLRGKTVLIPGGLSGTGAVALQLARNVFGAKVITTLSTKKIEVAKKLYGNDIKYIDYTKEDVLAAVGKREVDYLYDTQAVAMKYLSVMKKGGVIVSISSSPPGSLFKKRWPDMPWIVVFIMNIIDMYISWRARRVGVAYSYIFMAPSAKDLDRLSGWVKDGKVHALVGRTARLSNIEDVRSGCQEVYDGKGGTGKFVIEID